jgi:hypothetical protein
MQSGACFYQTAGGLRASQFGQATITACRPAHKLFSVMGEGLRSSGLQKTIHCRTVITGFLRVPNGRHTTGTRIPPVDPQGWRGCNPPVGLQDPVSGGVGFDHRACAVDKLDSKRPTDGVTRNNASLNPWGLGERLFSSLPPSSVSNLEEREGLS